MTKYYVEIQTEPRKPYQPNVGWDTLYATRAEAISAVARAKKHNWHDARVATIDAPADADHLYRCVQLDSDPSALYAGRDPAGDLGRHARRQED